VKTGDEVKHDLHINGSSLKKWAEEHDYPYRTVSDVVRGINKGTFGLGHEIAVKLGLKRDAKAA
jgi:gp16 family phage-associated protein